MTSIDNCYKPEKLIKLLEKKYLQNIDSRAKEIIIIGYNIICEKTYRKQSIRDPKRYSFLDSNFKLYLMSYEDRLRSMFYIRGDHSEPDVEKLLEGMKDFQIRDLTEIAEDLYYEALYGGSIFYKKKR